MILTDKEILSLCCDNSNQNALIIPFNEKHLQSESYDLSIGKQIAVLRKEIKCVDIENQNTIDSLYENQELTNNGYIISPHEYVLLTLNEKINLPENLTAHIRPRTRFTRLGLIVSDQHCNSTYSGVLQLGLFNATNSAIKIVPNLKIAQIVFEQLSSIPSENKQYKNKKNSAYHNETSFRGAKFSDEFKKSVDVAYDILLSKKNS